MVVQIGGGAAAVIFLGIVIVLGLNECSKGPLEPEFPANTSDEQKDWLRVQHRIQRSDASLVDVSRDQQGLTIQYRPAADQAPPYVWSHEMFRIVAGGLAALNNAPGGKQYRLVTVKAQVQTAPDHYVDGATLVYDMTGFDAIKTKQRGYDDFVDAPQSLTLTAPGRKVATEDCRGMEAGYYPGFCERVSDAK
jgi:hypothetical protein